MVSQTDSLAAHSDLGSLHTMPTYETTLSGLNVPKHANQPMDLN